MLSESSCRKHAALLTALAAIRVAHSVLHLLTCNDDIVTSKIIKLRESMWTEVNRLHCRKLARPLFSPKYAEQN